MRLLTHKYLRFMPAIYFMLLGTFSIVMEVLHHGLSGYWFCMYAILFLPMLIPVKYVWIMFGFILSFTLVLALLNQVGWFIQYLNGTNFKYPFDSFVIGFPFIVFTLLCALSIFYIGLKSEDTILLRIKKG